MELTELKSKIMKNDLGHVYVFVGEEIGIINIYLGQMSKVLNMPITRADSVASIYGKFMTHALFGSSSSGFYVIRNDTDFLKQDKVYETIENDCKDNYIVLLYDKIDNRLKFAKQFKDRIIQFEKLPLNILKSYIKKEIPLSDKNAEKLSNTCAGSYDLAMLEIDKIKNLIGYNVDDAFERLFRAGAIYQPEESDVFRLIECIMMRDVDESFRIYKILKEQGVQSINILGTLYNAVKATLLIQLCGGKNVCEVTGLDKGQAYYNRKYVGKYSDEHLVAMMKDIIQTVEEIKSGYIGEDVSVPYILVLMFRR